MERKLAASGQFQYSLTGQDRDPDLDPIEDFVTKHPVGHCEYFATALTLMLRSQGIPARMVSGYKCDRDDWDSLGGYYQVRQFHAHTWVEAYLRPVNSEYLSPANFPRLAARQGLLALVSNAEDRDGGWLRLDPTPAGAGDERTTWFTPVRQKLDWLESAWSNYVVELDVQTSARRHLRADRRRTADCVGGSDQPEPMARDVQFGRRGALPRSSQSRGPLGAAGTCGDRRGGNAAGARSGCSGGWDGD